MDKELENHDVDEIEQEDNVIIKHDSSGGTAMYTKINGQVGSSTRMEVGAVIHALRIPRPLHLAVDNQTVVTKVAKLIGKVAYYAANKALC